MSKNHKLATQVTSVVLENEDNMRTFILKLLECAPGTLLTVGNKLIDDDTTNSSLCGTLSTIVVRYNDPINNRLWNFMRKNKYNKIACIKYAREISHKDLRDAKLFVEKIANDNHYTFPENGDNYFPASHYNK